MKKQKPSELFEGENSSLRKTYDAATSPIQQEGKKEDFCAMCDFKKNPYQQTLYVSKEILDSWKKKHAEHSPEEAQDSKCEKKESVCGLCHNPFRGETYCPHVSPPRTDSEWEKEFCSLEITYEAGGRKWNEPLSLDPEEIEILIPFISQAIESARAEGKSYWEPSEHHKDVFREEGRQEEREEQNRINNSGRKLYQIGVKEERNRLKNLYPSIKAGKTINMVCENDIYIIPSNALDYD